MTVSAKKQTSSQKKRRASHFALKKNRLNVCSKCKKSIMPHHVCQFCGTYKEKETIKIRPNREERKLLKAKRSQKPIKS